MEWISTNERLPDETGVYLASIKRQLPNGIYYSNYSAHYDADSFKWYKYDPFDDDYKPKEDITSLVVGWMENMSSYFG